MTLSELISEIEDVISENFYGKTWWITAETSDIKNYPERGYCFVTLIEKEGKDVKAKMEAVIWRRHYSIISNFEFTTGARFDKNLTLLLHAGVVFNPVYGLRLEIYEIDASYTLGRLEMEKQRILRELVKNNPLTIRMVKGNYVTLNKTLPKPLIFKNIALITAPNSDGQRDFIHELATNPHGYKFAVFEFLTQIQGRDADQFVIRKLKEIEVFSPRIDAVVIVRGGGSQLDFSTFETYDIGKAIAEFKKIIITGIGHERNVSIADLMCHTSVKTPTKAASLIIDHNHAFEEELMDLQDHLWDSSRALIRNIKTGLDDQVARLETCTCQFIEKQQNELEKKAIAIKHLDPGNIINRGFAIVSLNNKIISGPELLHPGQEISVRLQKSTIRSVITSIEK